MLRRLPSSSTLVLAMFAFALLITSCGENIAETYLYQATPNSLLPSSGICGGMEGEIVTFTINPDIPDPRCVEVKFAQKIRIINRKGELLRISIGLFETDLEPGGEYTFEMPVGEYLAPGVHVLKVLPCCSPELWLKSTSE